MNQEIDSRAKRGLTRALPGNAAPRGVAIMGAYLVGMAAIAAGAYGLREQIVNAPVHVDHAVTTMPAPAPDPDAGVRTAAGIGIIGARPRTTPEGPRLAALEPTDIRLDDDLVSPLSRIFRGQPAAVPPARPLRDAQPEEDSGTVAPDEDAAAALRASLRPRSRPDDLRTTPPLEDVRLASLAPSQAPDETPDTTPRSQAPLPAAPRIADASADCPGRLARAMPRRTGNALGARTVMASLDGLDGVKRDQFVTREILGGNVPGFLRNLVPVSIAGHTSNGTPVTITLCVTPDYLALGSDRDFVRVPLGLRAATRIGDAFNMLLPTPRMVDMIYRAANLRLSPQPMTPGPQMTSTAYLLRHNQTIRAQRQQTGAALGNLIAGHKKDVVLTTRLASNRGRVAIYGWHRRNGRPIQPLSTVHGAGYADYSHGVRLVSRTAYLDGDAVDLRDLMTDPRYAGLLSDEGPVGGPRLRMAALAAN